MIYNSRNYISLLDDISQPLGTDIYNSRNYISLLDHWYNVSWDRIYNSRNYISLLDNCLLSISSESTIVEII